MRYWMNETFRWFMSTPSKPGRKSIRMGAGPPFLPMPTATRLVAPRAPTFKTFFGSGIVVQSKTAIAWSTKIASALTTDWRI